MKPSEPYLFTYLLFSSLEAVQADKNQGDSAKSFAMHPFSVIIIINLGKVQSFQ
jgi:hypothetical protein